ncbi:NmrA/HSCARG family protein [Micromonospora sp. CPCC 205711]|uniref:NmrA/HSCARG family protein n=1 Tax=Micromonospora sp. CPCC 205547 TaxID=3122400 RepID=UPI002FF40BDF
MTQIPYPSTIAVTGATGAQGGATARALLQDGHQVLALTRRPDSPAAIALRRLGAQVRYADFTDSSSLDTALAGATALFAVTTPFGTDVEQEVRDGLELLDAAARARLRHVVLTSAANADRDTGIPHFDSKHRIERHLATLGVPWTVIAPAAFMDQYAEEWTLRGLREGVYDRPMPAEIPLALIPTVDIGTFAALVLARPHEFAGRRIDIASDRRSGHEIATTLGAACGRDLRYVEYPTDRIEAYSPDLAAMFRYFTTVGLDVDVAGLRRDYPGVGWHTLPEWVDGRSWVLDDNPTPAGTPPHRT